MFGSSKKQVELASVGGVVDRIHVDRESMRIVVMFVGQHRKHHFDAPLMSDFRVNLCLTKPGDNVTINYEKAGRSSNWDIIRQFTNAELDG